MKTLLEYSLAQILVACGASLAFAGDGDRPSPKSDDSLPTIDRVITPEYGAGQYNAVLDMGILNVDTKYRVRVTLKNPSQDKLVFERVKPNCSCVDIKTSSLILEPDGELELEFTAPVPKRMSRPDAFWYMRLVPKAKSGLGGIGIKLNYKIAGLMAFRDKRAVLEVSKQEPVVVFKIPMVVTSPVEAENIQVILPESFVTCKAEIVSEGNGHFLKLEVPTDTLDMNYVAGLVECMDWETGITDMLYCVIKVNPGASVYPGILRPRKVEDNESLMAISAMIRVDLTAAKPLHDELSDGRNQSILVDVTLDGEPLRVKVKRLSSFVFKANITLTEKSVESLNQMEKPEIHWLIRTDQTTHRLRSIVSRLR